MYRRPKFLEILDEVRQEMSREADYDVDLFAEFIRNGLGNKDLKQDEYNSVPEINLREDLAPNSQK
jgi:hypothetical protein